MLDGNSAAEREYQFQEMRRRSKAAIDKMIEDSNWMISKMNEKAAFIQKLKDGGGFKPSHKNGSIYTVEDCFDFLPDKVFYDFPVELDFNEEYNNGNLKHLEVEIEAAIIKLADWVYEI